MRNFLFGTFLTISLAASLHSFGNHFIFQGIHSNSMGSTYSGFNSGAEVVWHNPAFISSITEKFSISTGAQVKFQSTRFMIKEPSMYQAVTEIPTTYPIYINIATRINDRLGLGLSINSAFSDEIKWQEENWAGRFIIKEMELSTTIFQPALSYNFSEYISLGAGLIIAHARLNYDRALPLRDQNREGSVNISGETIQYGFNVGVFSRINEKLNLGLNLKSMPMLQFNDAQALFLVPASLRSYYPENNAVNTTWPMATILDLNGGWKIAETLDLAWGVAFLLNKNSSDTDFDFQHNNDFLHDFSLVRNDKNALVIRLGANYQPIEFWHVRAGGWYQSKSSDPDYFSPADFSSDRIALTAGTSFIPFSGLSVDLGFVFIVGQENKANYAPGNFAGKYLSYYFKPGLGVSYAF